MSNFPGTWVPNSVTLNQPMPPEQKRSMDLLREAVGSKQGIGPVSPTITKEGQPDFDGTTDPGKPGEPV